MRFFGGGVGHNGVGVSLEKSRHRADRVERSGHAQTVHVDSSSSSESADSDEELGGLSRACEEAEQALDEALQALQESDEEEEEDLTGMLLADPNEDAVIEWGDLFALGGADELQANEDKEREEEEEEEEEEDADLYADYSLL